jgi:2-methylcitrate dehydratase PrpD
VDANELKSHCSQYIMAVAAVLRQVPPDAIVHDYRLSDARIGAMAGRTSLVGDVAEPGFGPGSAVVEVTTRDGRAITEKLPHWRGHQNDPLTRPELEAKFLRLATMRLPQASAERIMELCDDLENLPDAAQLAELLGVPEESA